MRKSCLFVIALLIGMWSQVQGVIAQSCSTSTMSGSYGVVDVLAGSAVDSSTTFTVSCSFGSSFATVRFCLEVGIGTAPCNTLNGTLRNLCSGSDLLEHGFFTDAARTTNWGSWGSVVTANGTGGVTYDLALNGFGSGSHTFTVYSRVSANQQTVPPGSYSWTTSSPGVRYGYKGASSCPTGGGTDASSGSTWTATVNAGCSVSAVPLDFGTSKASIGSNLDSTATITTQCTNTTAYSIGLALGTNATGSQNRMRLGATANYVNYGVYTDAARSIVWKTTTSATSCTNGASTCILGTGTGNGQTTTIYGRVPPQTVAAIGTFTDAITVTVTF